MFKNCWNEKNCYGHGGLIRPLTSDGAVGVRQQGAATSLEQEGTPRGRLPRTTRSSFQVAMSFWVLLGAAPAITSWFSLRFLLVLAEQGRGAGTGEEEWGAAEQQRSETKAELNRGGATADLVAGRLSGRVAKCLRYPSGTGLGAGDRSRRKHFRATQLTHDLLELAVSPGDCSTASPFQRASPCVTTVLLCHDSSSLFVGNRGAADAQSIPAARISLRRW